MTYVLTLKRDVEKELDHLPKNVHAIIIRKLESLKNNPRPTGIKKLQGREGYRLRVGNYRVLYVVDDSKKKIEIYSVGHRKDVYRF